MRVVFPQVRCRSRRHCSTVKTPVPCYAASLCKSLYTINALIPCRAILLNKDLPRSTPIHTRTPLALVFHNVKDPRLIRHRRASDSPFRIYLQTGTLERYVLVNAGSGLQSRQLFFSLKKTKYISRSFCLAIIGPTHRPS
jgi:hypothetical protein